MKAKLVLCFFLFLGSYLLSGQEQQTDFYGNPISSDPCDEYSHSNDMEIEFLMMKIAKALGSTRNKYFMQPCRSLANCSAKLVNGREYILYNPAYLNKVKKLNFSTTDLPGDDLDWAVVGVLAHEVGHHLNGHLTNPGLSNHEKELEADFQAGFILYMLGATNFQSAAACLSTLPEQASLTHPARQDRIREFSKGWVKARNMLGGQNEIDNKDTDGDGIPDLSDECPNEYGLENTKGCPDNDGDGVPNKSDQCPSSPGKPGWAGCPDTDGDGIPDHEDKCKNDRGTILAHGCPDKDSDGVPDSEDKCPDAPGTPANKGCPSSSDRDGDGVPDVSDLCPADFGLKNLQGCPDGDGDGIPDKEDKCPGEKGTYTNSGCPEIQGDFISDPLIGKMILVKGGSFNMGCSMEQTGCEADEFPPRVVSVKDYYIGETEITQAIWKSIMETNPSKNNSCSNCPVESVSWDDVQIFISRLNNRAGGNKYRLPTEIEWEYAARGGTLSKGYKYAGGNSMNEVGWYSENAGEATKPVKGKKSNELGLYDMSGNVWEWCSDYFGVYLTGIPVNPYGPSSGFLRICRGGAWNYPQTNCRVSERNADDPSIQFEHIGLRLARSL
jgi:formylglycine-generating enzyme required for sulfatase activity